MSEKYLQDCVAVSFHLNQSFAMVQTSRAIPTYATRGHLEKSILHSQSLHATKTAGSLPAGQMVELNP